MKSSVFIASLCLIMSIPTFLLSEEGEAIPGSSPYRKELAPPGIPPDMIMYEEGSRLILPTGIEILVGSWQIKMKSGKVIKDGYYDANGRKSGKWRQYNPDSGSIISEMGFADDKLDGLSITFFKNQRPRYISWYKMGKLDGYVVHLAESGMVTKVEQYSDGVKMGGSP